MVQFYQKQLDAINKLHSGNILVGGTGSGKSRTSIGWWYFRACGGSQEIQIMDPATREKLSSFGSLQPMQKPKDLYIITTAHKRDQLEFDGELANFGLENGENPFDGVRITVDSWNNIAKYRDIHEACFIFDEQRVVGKGLWVKSFLALAKTNAWILCSATPGDTWMDYIPVFVANGFYKNRTAFLNRHAVWNRYAKYPKVDRFVDENILLGYRNRITVTMKVPRLTVQHTHTVPVQYDKKLVDGQITRKRWNPYTEWPIKDISEYCSVLKKAIFSDHSRLEALEKLMSEHPRLILFYTYDSELEVIRQCQEKCSAEGYSYAEYNGHQHDDCPTTERWVYVVQYSAGSEAWNCTSTDTIVFWSMSYSWKQMEQAKGRIDRLDTKYRDLHYYIMKSSSKLEVQMTKTLSSKRDFNERKFFGKMKF